LLVQVLRFPIAVSFAAFLMFYIVSAAPGLRIAYSYHIP